MKAPMSVNPMLHPKKQKNDHSLFKVFFGCFGIIALFVALYAAAGAALVWAINIIGESFGWVTLDWTQGVAILIVLTIIGAFVRRPTKP
jgi:cell division protein FtsX